MSDQFLGEIRMVGFTFAPQGWAMCNGQLLAISQNTALFSLLGTTYGGNGVQTFALPNLQSRIPVGMGQGQGLSPYVQGQVGGNEHQTLLVNNLPVHAHSFALQASTNQADKTSPQGAIFAAANDGNTNPIYPYTQTAGNTTMSQQNTAPVGGSVPVPILQPYLAMNFIIALVGIFPSRS